jgi:hypothetical protein
MFAVVMSYLSNKSDILCASAQLLHDNCYYPAVAHCAYYSCYQLLKHIWLTTMHKTEDELDVNCSQTRLGSHEYLLNEVAKYIKGLQNKDSNNDFRILCKNIPQLKRIRVNADYKNAEFGSDESGRVITMSNETIRILKKY